MRLNSFELRGKSVVSLLSREAQLFVGWVSGSVTHAGVGFHASTQPTFILYLIPPTHLTIKTGFQWLIHLYFSYLVGYNQGRSSL
ncbi:MAG: hypothetical protein EWV74_19045 [Microcystis wesenbergii Mw_QC_S_20081001_S30]|nr:MAG: hypothetical protein EWV74_19045 [Microcystis wesenbergii Mw_QC_S_20081001_S30]